MRIVTPDLFLQLGREHRQLVAVGAQQTHGPGRAGAGAGKQGNAIGELRQRDLHAAKFFRLKRPVHPDAFQQRDVFRRDLTVLFSLESVGSDGRQKRLEIFEQGVRLFHGSTLLIIGCVAIAHDQHSRDDWRA
ncbi:hypothetical protein D3C71_1689710 [compost metagenome]